MKRPAAILLVSLVAACGAAIPAPDDEPISELDTMDRCTALPRECIEGFDFSDDDGCPDPPVPEVPFTAGSAVLSEDAERVLEAVAIDARHLWPGATLRLVSIGAELAAERSAQVRAGLVARGVPVERIAEGGPVPDAGDGRVFLPVSVVMIVDHCAM